MGISFSRRLWGKREHQQRRPQPTSSQPTRIHLFNDENNWLLRNNAISTITFFEGDFVLAGSFLRQRVHQILQLNPWLAGTFGRDAHGSLCMMVDAEAPERVDAILQVLATPVDNLSITTEYQQLMKSCIPLGLGHNALLNAHQLLKRKAPYTRIVVVPTREGGFALVFSLSHVVADGYTYYEVLNMLSDHANCVVRALNPIRKREFETNLLPKLAGPQVARFKQSLTLIKAYLVGDFNKCPTKVTALWVDENKVREIKLGSNGSPNTTSFVSTNDIVTSHFARVCQPRLLLMAVNYRPRCNKVLTADDAGNYAGPVFLDQPNYQDPTGIRGCLTPNEQGALTGLTKELPGFFESWKLSVITNWAIQGTSPPFDLTQPGFRQVLHLPLLFVPNSLAKIPVDIAIVFRPLPSKLAVLLLVKNVGVKQLVEAWRSPFGAIVNGDVFPDGS